MTRRDRFRARGAGSRSGSRSPQISDGIFQGATAVAAVRPTQFSVIAYAPTAFPGVELWCYRMRRSTANDGSLTYLQLGVNAPPAAPTNAEYLWLDQIPAAEEFVPPAGYPPESQPTIDALKIYASYRWTLAHGQTDAPGNWDVSVNRPYPFSPPGSQATRIQHDKVYLVFQRPVPGGGQDLLTGWLWVPYDEFDPQEPVGREIWLHYRPNEPGGFGVVGATPMGLGAPYTQTRLHFQDWTPANGEADTWSLLDYQDAIAKFTTWAMSHHDNPASDASELEVLDYRVQDLA